MYNILITRFFSLPVPNLTVSLQGHGFTHKEHDDTVLIHVIEIINGSFAEKASELRIECDNTVEFKVNGKDEYDIIQVYKDGNDYYPVKYGCQLLNIKSRTAPKQRRIPFSFDLNQPEIELYFCVIPSSQRESIIKGRKYPKVYCEKNRLKLHQNDIKFRLTDERQSQKVYMHQTDTVQIEWTSQRLYRIEEKKYCPTSGGFYTVEQPNEKRLNRFSTKGSFVKTFNDLGMSFLIRYTEQNEIHDVIVCIINEKYKVKHVEITDEDIQPNILWIEQTDWVVFDWNTKRKHSIVQIEPFSVDTNTNRSIEVCFTVSNKQVCFSRYIFSSKHLKNTFSGQMIQHVEVICFINSTKLVFSVTKQQVIKLVRLLSKHVKLCIKYLSFPTKQVKAKLRLCKLTKILLILSSSL